MRFFNTAGPVVAQDHYCVPPLERIDRGELLRLIDQKKYFVLHAPRQTGKTSALLALLDALNAGGQYRAVYVNVEIGQSAREDVGAAMQAILSQMARRAEYASGDAFVKEIWRASLEESGPHNALQDVLSRWAAADTRPLVLMIDEIDALVGDTLLAVLRQLRAGYPDRPRWFPQSVILCGVRDVRDYRIHSSAEKAVVAGGSAFNIKAKSLRLGDFSPLEVLTLLEQHTEETGQTWTAGAKDAIRSLTRGQPWLVNALAYQACFEERAGRDRSRPVTEQAIRDACEQLILRRETHLDQLTDKLQEERVRRVVEPLLSGARDSEAPRPDDLQYARDLGLIRADGPVEIANPIYREVIPRDLTYTTQMTLYHDPAWYVEDGALRIDKLLAAFQTFFREHSEHWLRRVPVPGSGPPAPAPGVPAAHRQQRRPHRTRVRAGQHANGPARPLAGGRCAGRRGEDRRRVQVPPQVPRPHHRAGSRPDPGVHVAVRRGSGPSRRLRPHGRQAPGRRRCSGARRSPMGAPVTIWGM